MSENRCNCSSSVAVELRPCCGCTRGGSQRGGSRFHWDFAGIGWNKNGERTLWYRWAFCWSVCPDRGRCPPRRGPCSLEKNGRKSRWILKWVRAGGGTPALCAPQSGDTLNTLQDFPLNFLCCYLDTSVFSLIPAFALLWSYIFHPEQGTNWVLVTRLYMSVELH